MAKQNLKFTKVKDVKSPTRGTKLSAGIDFYVPTNVDKIELQPGQSTLIPSGIKVNVLTEPSSAFNTELFASIWLFSFTLPPGPI